MFRLRIFALSIAAAPFLLPAAPAQAAFVSQLYPPAPFPLVTGQAETTSIMANGVSYAHYTLLTTSGPLSINAILADARAPSTQFRTVLAQDRLVSPGETVSSMARRTGAIAGINGDYFARGATNEPLNIVINNGIVYRTPGKRVALAIHSNGAISMDMFHYSGTVNWASGSVPVTGINQWPPEGGASLMLPAYGAPAPHAGVLFASLAPVSVTAQGTSYRVVAESDGTAPRQTLGLALGPAAMSMATPPEVGETVVISGGVEPASNDIVTAIGGGPQLLAGGDYTPLVNLPRNDETPSSRLPLSGAARTSDGSLLLLEVDGRQPLFSVGLTRPEFAALMSAFGAFDAMCFDSGGSSTLVAQLPGEPAPSVRNHPSDGHERRVANGLFVYSNALMPPPPKQPNVNVIPAYRPAVRHIPKTVAPVKNDPLPLGENPDL